MIRSALVTGEACSRREEEACEQPPRRTGADGRQAIRRQLADVVFGEAGSQVRVQRVHEAPLRIVSIWKDYISNYLTSSLSGWRISTW